MRFAYDYMSRRVEKEVETWTGMEWSNVVTIAFTYDGWNMISEARSDESKPNYYVWGLDLSGTLQGAGGVGGLLARVRQENIPHPLYYASDANGNITDVLNNNGTLAAHYEYDPYGNTIAQSGDLADANPFRFSSKYCDAGVGVYYYGFRFYSPSLGRFISRDPLPEVSFRTHSLPKTIQFEDIFLDAEMLAFIESIAADKPGLAEYLRNRWKSEADTSTKATLLYTFVKNGPVNHVDALGLDLFLGSYGKYCGPGWCGGKEQKEKDCVCSKTPLPDPDNAIDACCKTHDLCLGGGGSHECDDAMCDCLKGVDPVNETVPPGSSLDRQIKSYNKMLGLFCGMKIPGH